MTLTPPTGLFGWLTHCPTRVQRYPTYFWFLNFFLDHNYIRTSGESQCAYLRLSYLLLAVVVVVVWCGLIDWCHWWDDGCLLLLFSHSCCVDDDAAEKTTVDADGGDRVLDGIWILKARQKDHMWRILGYIPQVTHHKSRGRRITIDSNHVDSVMAHPDALNDEGNQPATNVERAQDFHAMLSTVLASHIELQETGFVWDLCCRGQVHKNIEFILFAPFMKVDGDEADKLCGKCLCWTKCGTNLPVMWCAFVPCNV